MQANYIIERELPDEIDGTPTLILQGYQWGIEDSPRNVALRRGKYVRLTQQGQRELSKVNYQPHHERWV